MVGLSTVKKNFEDMCNRLGTIPVCDRQTDRQTSCQCIVRAMHTRRAVKMAGDTHTLHSVSPAGNSCHFVLLDKD